MEKDKAGGLEGGSENRNEQRNTEDQSGREQRDNRKDPEGYKNIQTSVNNPGAFDEDFATEQEKEMGREEADSEDENNVPDRRRSD